MARADEITDRSEGSGGGARQLSLLPAEQALLGCRETWESLAAWREEVRSERGKEWQRRRLDELQGWSYHRLVWDWRLFWRTGDRRL